MPEYLFWHIVVLLGTGLLGTYWMLQGRHRLFVGELLQQFSAKNIQTSRALFGWKRILFGCRVSAKQFFVEYRFRNFRRKDRKTNLISQIDSELEIRIPVVQKFWLRLIQQQQDEAPSEDIITGIAELDKHYLIHANQEEAAISFLKLPSVQDRLLQFPIFPDRIEIHKGFLKAVFNQPYRQQIRRETFETSVYMLLNLVDVYQTQQFSIFQKLTADDNLSCPYCRGTFDFSSELIVKCSQCGTSVHQQCWTENQQCTTWGCFSITSKDQSENVITQE